MRRPFLVASWLVVLLAVVPAAHAQLGGIKKRVVDKATGKQPEQPAAATNAQPKCDPSEMVITKEVVDRYAQAYAVRDAEMQKLAKEPGKTGAYYTALLKRRAVERRKAEYDLHRGPDWEKHQALQKRYMGGDGGAIREEEALSESLNPNRVDVPDLEWEAQQKGNARIDNAMREAGGFSECDWYKAAERLPRLVNILAYDPGAKDLQGAGTPAEAAAVRPRIAELARGMGINYVSPEDKARLEAEKEAAASAVPQPVSTGDPFLDCVNKVQAEWATVHKTELDAAQNSQDVNVLMKLSQQMQQESLAKCKSQ
jgi:hypothetical protein